MFTKGGWEAEESRLRLSADWKIRDDNGLTLAKIYMHNGEQEANAHLIAASPDMYEALKEAADYMGENAYPETTLEKARRALSKAEGK